MRVGENVTVEIALRVLGTPLDPIMNKDSNCAGVQGAEIASSDTNSSGTNNPWGFFDRELVAVDGRWVLRAL